MGELIFHLDFLKTSQCRKFFLWTPRGLRHLFFQQFPYCLLLVYPDGRVCISILHPPGDDPTGYESSSERWSPVQSIEKILISVVSMLAEPNDESPANVDAAKMYREDRSKFNDIARKSVRKTLGLWFTVARSAGSNRV